VSSLRGIKRMEFPLSVRKKAFVRCCRDGVPYCEGCGIEINARTGIIYEHVIPAGLGGEPTRVWQRSTPSAPSRRRSRSTRRCRKTETTFSALASAMMKFAPDLAEELVKRFREAQREQEAGLEEFLKVLRASPGRD
jgi:hypothetical protein